MRALDGYRRYQLTVLNARALRETADALRSEGAAVIPEAVDLIDKILEEVTPVVLAVRYVQKLITGSSYYLVTFSNGQSIRVTNAKDQADAIYIAQHEH